ncbi:uncharacterized protein LOC116964757 [Tyto alba]|uniref:uncharacterized protein LOC116964757 n=1 Tax=Tyto alba TaxID=56313 RepID=UPI0014041DD3|nr:uncharacterized protein LOC116964757 [Tyto alba]
MVPAPVQTSSSQALSGHQKKNNPGRRSCHYTRDTTNVNRHRKDLVPGCSPDGTTCTCVGGTPQMVGQLFSSRVSSLRLESDYRNCSHSIPPGHRESWCRTCLQPRKGKMKPAATWMQVKNWTMMPNRAEVNPANGAVHVCLRWHSSSVLFLSVAHQKMGRKKCYLQFSSSMMKKLIFKAKLATCGLQPVPSPCTSNTRLVPSSSPVLQSGICRQQQGVPLASSSPS